MAGGRSAPRPRRLEPALRSFPGARLALLAVLVVAVTADVFRLGWFADDFHLLDAARRFPLTHTLTGQHGI